jgi:hypothetical protein
MPEDTPDDHDDTFQPYEDDSGETHTEMPEADNDAFDRWLTAELNLPHNDTMQRCTVTRRTRNSDGKIQGRSDSNPQLDTRVYDVTFADGAIKQYAANVIAENLYSQVDSEGNQYTMMKEIVDHRKSDAALTKENMYVVTNRGQRKLRKTTIGWEFKILWKDGSTSWCSLKELKEANPVEIAKYVVSAGIDDEPAFKWWVPYTLRKRDVIVSAVNQQIKISGYKYGIKVPKDINEAKKLDELNKNNEWEKSVTKEMSTVLVAFDILEEDQHIPPGYDICTCHIIFDVKIDGTC